MKIKVALKTLKFLFVLTSILFVANQVKAQIAEGIEPIFNATVQIEVFDKSGSKIGAGSGFIVDSTGILVTNNHILSGASSVIVKLANGDIYKEIVIRDFDEVKDLAIVKIGGFDLPQAKLGNSNKAEVGTKVYVFGNVLDEYGKTTREGIISGIRHHEKGFRFIQITAPISAGDSGGPVATQNGEVIGVSVDSKIEGRNISFVVPINYVLN